MGSIAGMCVGSDRPSIDGGQVLGGQPALHGDQLAGLVCADHDDRGAPLVRVSTPLEDESLFRLAAVLRHHPDVSRGPGWASVGRSASTQGTA